MGNSKSTCLSPGVRRTMSEILDSFAGASYEQCTCNRTEVTIKVIGDT